jgi:hypothetical protein
MAERRQDAPAAGSIGIRFRQRRAEAMMPVRVAA